MRRKAKPSWSLGVLSVVTIVAACGGSVDSEQTAIAGSPGTGGSAAQGDGGKGGGATGGSGKSSATAGCAPTNQDCVGCNGVFTSPACENGAWHCVPPVCGSGGTSGGGKSTSGGAGGGGGAGGSAGSSDCSRLTTDGATQQTLADFCAHEYCPASIDEAMASFADGFGFSTRSSGCGYTLIEAATPVWGARYFYDSTSGALIAAERGDDVTSPPCDTYGYVGGALPATCAAPENCIFANRDEWTEDGYPTPEQATWPWCSGFGTSGGAGGAAGAAGMGGGGAANDAGASAGGSAGAH